MSSELNMSLEYLPITKELKDVSSLKNKDVGLEQTSQDAYNNPRFQLNPNTTCTMQTTRNGKGHVAFVRVSEQVDNSYNNSYYKAFSPREDYGESNDPVYFENFREGIKEEETGKGIQRDN